MQSIQINLSIILFLIIAKPPLSQVTNHETSENENTESEPLHPKCDLHSKESHVTSGISTPAVHTTSQDRDSLNSPYHRPVGKHMTLRPIRYVSPLEGGLLLHPPPDVHQAMNLPGCL
jgi:hypothetical protein